MAPPTKATVHGVSGQNPGSTQVTSHSPLLELPAKLRNRIYEYALQTDDKIHVDKHWKPPALCATNNQIRYEASAIYFLGNHFRVDCPGFEPSVLLNFKSCFNDYPGFTSKRASFRIQKWLQHYHAHELNRVGISADRRPAWKAVCRAFDIVEKMRDKSTWEEVLQVLEIYRAAVEEQAAGAWTWS